MRKLLFSTFRLADCLLSYCLRYRLTHHQRKFRSSSINLSLVSLSAVLGYWLERLFPRRPPTPPPRKLIAVLRRGDDSSRDHRCGNLPLAVARSCNNDARYQYVCPVCVMTFLSAEAPNRRALSFAQWRNEVILRTAREIPGAFNACRHFAGQSAIRTGWAPPDARSSAGAQGMARNLCLQRQNG